MKEKVDLINGWEVTGSGRKTFLANCSKVSRQCTADHCLANNPSVMSPPSCLVSTDDRHADGRLTCARANGEVKKILNPITAPHHPLE